MFCDVDGKLVGLAQPSADLSTYEQTCQSWLLILELRRCFAWKYVNEYNNYSSAGICPGARPVGLELPWKNEFANRRSHVYNNISGSPSCHHTSFYRAGLLQHVGIIPRSIRWSLNDAQRYCDLHAVTTKADRPFLLLVNT